MIISIDVVPDGYDIKCRFDELVIYHFAELPADPLAACLELWNTQQAVVINVVAENGVTA